MQYITGYKSLDVVAPLVLFFQAKNNFSKYRKYLLILGQP